MTIVVPFAAGGGSDLLARLVAQKLEERLGKPFIIENRPGAGTTLAAMQVVRADARRLHADAGHQLDHGHQRDHEQEAALRAAEGPRAGGAAVVVAVLPGGQSTTRRCKTVADLIALAKAKPNGLNYGSGGPGSMHHLSTELLQSLAGIQMTHVPYKATPPAMNDLIAGHIQVLFGDTTSTLPMIQQGKVRGARGHHGEAQPGGAGRSDRGRDACRASSPRPGRCWWRRARRRRR